MSRLPNKVAIEQTKESAYEMAPQPTHMLDSPLLYYLKSRLLHWHLCIEAEELHIVAQPSLVGALAVPRTCSSGPGWRLGSHRLQWL